MHKVQSIRVGVLGASGYSGRELCALVQGHPHFTLAFATAIWAAAATLVEQLNTLARQLTAGVHANGDGRVTWNDAEGGLQLLEQHLGFMLQSGQ